MFPRAAPPLVARPFSANFVPALMENLNEQVEWADVCSCSWTLPAVLAEEHHTDTLL
jgi:hypothetical protein